MGSVRILIIDDDTNIINSLKLILNKHNYILYSTTDSKEAIEIIENNKLDIIICNYNNEEIVTIIEKVAQEKHELSKKLKHKIFAILENEDIVLIKSTEIYYLYADDGSVTIVTEKDKYKSNDSLANWVKKLDDSFFRCHRSYIVNIEKIEKISPWFNGAYNLKIKKLDETIPASRRYMKELKKLFSLN